MAGRDDIGEVITHISIGPDQTLEEFKKKTSLLLFLVRN